MAQGSRASIGDTEPLIRKKIKRKYANRSTAVGALPHIRCMNTSSKNLDNSELYDNQS